MCVCVCALCVCVCVRVCVAGVVAKGKYFLRAQKENAHSVSNAIKHVCGEYIIYYISTVLPRLSHSLFHTLMSLQRVHVEDRQRWRQLVARSSMAPYDPLGQGAGR